MRGDGTAARAENTVVPLLNDHVFQISKFSKSKPNSCNLKYPVPLNSDRDRDQIVAVVPRYTEYKRNFMGETPRQGSFFNSCFFF